MENGPKNLGKVVATEDGSLSLEHPDHGEAYHSRLGADAESRLLYVEASGFRTRLDDASTPLAILDVGLGLGYNAVHTIEAWRDHAAPPPLEIVSLEIAPELVAALACGAAPWQANWTPARRAIATALVSDLPGQVSTATLKHPANGHRLAWKIVVADAANAPLPHASRPYDFIWQDPFSPEKNPPMWSETWFKKLHGVVAADATLMTYSVARSVRDALTAGGFAPERFLTASLGAEGARIARYKRQWLRAKPV